MLFTLQCTRTRQNSVSKDLARQKGLHYIESLTEVEKQECSTLQGLFDTLAKNLDHNIMKPSSCSS